MSPNADPPVCKIMDYKKFCYDRKKKEKNAKKQQHIPELKEIRLSVKIDSGDIDTKVSHARKFLGNGDRVKVSVRFKGREMQHTELGFDVLKSFFGKCSEFASVEKGPILEGKQLFAVLSKNGEISCQIPNIQKGFVSERK